MKHAMIALLLAAGTLLAQPPAGGAPGMRGPRGPMAKRMAAARGAEAVKESLGLTDTQVQQLRELRRQRAEAARPAMEQLRQNREAIAEAMKADNPDAARVGQLMVDGKRLRESMRGSGEEYRAKAQALLTPEQKTKLEELQKAGRRGGAARQAMGLGLIEPPAKAGRAEPMRRERGRMR